MFDGWVQHAIKNWTQSYLRFCKNEESKISKICLVHTSISFQHFLLQLPPTISLSSQTSIYQVHIYLYVPPYQFPPSLFPISLTLRQSIDTCIYYSIYLQGTHLPVYTISIPVPSLFVPFSLTLRQSIHVYYSIYLPGTHLPVSLYHLHPTPTLSPLSVSLRTVYTI